MNDYMTGKEIVNLIEKLQEKGLSSDEIIDEIKAILYRNCGEDTK